MASVTNGVAPNQVTSINVVVVDSTSTSHAHLMRGDWDVSSTEDSAVLHYDVTTYDPTISFEDLKERIETASTDDELGENIRYYAGVFNADGLSDAAVGPATVTDANARSSGGDSNSDSGLGEGAIVGIAIGAVLLAVLVTIVLACSFQACKYPTSEEPLQARGEGHQGRVSNRT